MTMNIRYVRRLVPVIVVAGLITASAFAKNGNKSEKKVTLNQTAALNGAAIPVVIREFRG